MNELPKGFPELSIMYKTLGKKIQELKRKNELASISEKTDIKKSISTYELEREKIRNKFPRNFFED